MNLTVGSPVWGRGFVQIKYNALANYDPSANGNLIGLWNAPQASYDGDALAEADGLGADGLAADAVQHADQVRHHHHRLAIAPHRDSYAAHNLLSRGQTVEAEFDEVDAVDIELAPGDSVRLETAGGAGYGDPTTREPARLAADIADGKVPAED